MQKDREGMKHKAKPTELAFDQPLDFRLIQDTATDWDVVRQQQEQADKDRKENDERQTHIV